MKRSVLMVTSLAVAPLLLLAACNQSKDQPKQQLVSDTSTINTDIQIQNTSEPNVAPSGRAPRCGVKPVYCERTVPTANGLKTERYICQWVQSGECN